MMACVWGLAAGWGTVAAAAAAAAAGPGGGERHFFPASDQRLVVVGRTRPNHDVNGSVSFDWPSVHVSMRVQAPVSIWLSEPPPGNATPPASCVRCVPPFNFGIRYLVFVDGLLVRKLNTTAIPGSPVTEWPLFMNEGVHTVRIERILEADYGSTTFHGVSAAALLEPPPLPTRRVEFIGDSMMSGDACMARMDTPSAKVVGGQWTTKMCGNDTTDWNFEKVDSSWHSWGPVM